MAEVKIEDVVYQSLLVQLATVAHGATSTHCS
jgi:hypothetical protein